MCPGVGSWCPSCVTLVAESCVDCGKKKHSLKFVSGAPVMLHYSSTSKNQCLTQLHASAKPQQYSSAAVQQVCWRDGKR